jgi:hypothetical protein
MELITEFAVLTAATVLAAGAAIGLNWFLLKAAFQLMQPAGARPVRHEPVVHTFIGAACRFVRANHRRTIARVRGSSICTPGLHAPRVSVG